MAAAIDPRRTSRPPDWLSAHIVDPEVIGPGVRDVPVSSDEAEVAAIRAALAKMRVADPPAVDEVSRRAIVLFNRHCLSCHVMGSVGGTDGPDLTHVGEKLDPGVIERRIVNPAEVQIDAKMPAVRRQAHAGRDSFDRALAWDEKIGLMRRPPSASRLRPSLSVRRVRQVRRVRGTFYRVSFF